MYITVAAKELKTLAMGINYWDHALAPRRLAMVLHAELYMQLHAWARGLMGVFTCFQVLAMALKTLIIDFKAVRYMVIFLATYALVSSFSDNLASEETSLPWSIPPFHWACPSDFCPPPPNEDRGPPPDATHAYVATPLRHHHQTMRSTGSQGTPAGYGDGVFVTHLLFVICVNSA
ncbi:hypothetical protein MAPG_11725 [Magnaporthiopsis poae ATCC 64411]|uniref:Uncharacterized protein n=1 Tax=Magnaporthiopsis poae (strain ATCC 64411 / 73-15) TaxID=644358 RepID=A0A0C4EG11_MAGP6|nr:hypothetical protein MAPG_11725 [Magnaporthiopsis poae ATCC 64411]